MQTKNVRDAAAEPMAWFQHDANSSHDSKCQRLLYRYGNAGYGAYWRLCELLAVENGHSISLETDEDWSILTMGLGIKAEGDFIDIDSVEKCKVFIDCLLEIGLLVRNEQGAFESDRMTRNSLYFGAQRAAGRANGSKGGRPRKQKAEQ